MTLTQFNKFYKQYKDDFDLELCLKLSKTTYEGARNKAEKEQEWF